jgi:hypothetical protein
VDALTHQVAVPAWVTYYRGDLVTTSARLSDDCPPGPATCTENHELAHPATPHLRPA